jgi:hypothetical protein
MGKMFENNISSRESNFLKFNYLLGESWVVEIMRWECDVFKHLQKQEFLGLTTTMENMFSYQ